MEILVSIVCLSALAFSPVPWFVFLCLQSFSWSCWVRDLVCYYTLHHRLEGEILVIICSSKWFLQRTT